MDKGKVIHNLFETVIFIKGFNGAWEIVVGLIIFFLKTSRFSASTQHFLAAYFFVYGLINIFLVVCLLRKKLWAYPVSMVFFSLFILYQLFRFYQYHSMLLLFFSAFDIVFVVMTWFEYKRVSRGVDNIGA